jgi:DNA-binding NarL/FixJ family response regulator
MLDSQPQVEVVGEAGDFAETLLLMEGLKPNVVVMDLHMPGEFEVKPIDVKSQVRKGKSLLLAVSIWDDEGTIALAECFGASLLLNKSDLATTLVPAILRFHPHTPRFAAD